MKHPALLITHTEELGDKGSHTSPKSEKVKIEVKLTARPVTSALAKTSCFLASLARYAKSTGAIVAVKTITKSIRMAVMMRSFYYYSWLLCPHFYYAKADISK